MLEGQPSTKANEVPRLSFIRRIASEAARVAITAVVAIGLYNNIDDTDRHLGQRLDTAEADIAYAETRALQAEAALSSRIDSTVYSLERTADYFAQANVLDNDTIIGRGLAQVSSLPGYSLGPIKAKVPDISELEASSVLIAERKKGEGGDYSAVCSGNKISHNGQSYVLTANHCLDYSFDTKPKGADQTANIVEVDSNEYVIGAPHTEVPKKGEKSITLAAVTGISIFANTNRNPDGTDIALLKVKTTKSKSGRSRFSQINAIELDESAEPIPGESVALYSSPVSVAKTTVSGYGRYLGEAKCLEDKGQVVGIPNVTDSRKDPLQHGGSGHVGITASGAFLGPFKARVGNPQAINQPRGKDRDTGAMAITGRHRYEKALGLDLKNYKDLGCFTLRQDDTIKQLVQGMRFKVPAAAASK